jgi:hypothetical protein
VADYPAHEVEFEYVPGSTMIVVTIAAELADVLQRRAVENGVSVETLVNLWVQERITAV